MKNDLDAIYFYIDTSGWKTLVTTFILIFMFLTEIIKTTIKPI